MICVSRQYSPEPMLTDGPHPGWGVELARPQQGMALWGLGGTKCTLTLRPELRPQQIPLPCNIAGSRKPLTSALKEHSIWHWLS